MAPASVGLGDRGYKLTVLSQKHCLAPSGMIHASIQNPTVHVTSKLWLSVQNAAVQWFTSPRLSPHSNSCRGCSSMPDFSSPCGPAFPFCCTQAAVSSVLLLEMEQKMNVTPRPLLRLLLISSGSWSKQVWLKHFLLGGGMERGYRRYHHITVNGASLIVSN